MSQENLHQQGVVHVSGLPVDDFAPSVLPTFMGAVGRFANGCHLCFTVLFVIMLLHDYIVNCLNK